MLGPVDDRKAGEGTHDEAGIVGGADDARDFRADALLLELQRHQRPQPAERNLDQRHAQQHLRDQAHRLPHTPSAPAAFPRQISRENRPWQWRLLRAEDSGRDLPLDRAIESARTEERRRR